MKINENIFCLPPYISTSWNNISALYMKETTLMINLFDGETVQIPDLKPEVLELIFECHAKFLEENTSLETHEGNALTQFSFQQSQAGIGGETEFPLKFGIGAMDAWGAALQHNPIQANMPNLPEEVLEKVRSISKIIAPEDSSMTPKPEPHCNCMHCQIARAINQGLGLNDIYLKTDHPIEEAISETDLNFQQWDIEQTDEKMYVVTNRLDRNETYHVFLGRPIGCTCGKEGCEHILVVLKS